MHLLFVRHHIRPKEFLNMERGEQLFLAASLELEIEAEQNQINELERKAKRG